MFPKIPYGESNFKTVISENYVYIDKTDYIPKLEAAGKYLFLLRPRRFGKSLFLSMLEHYYDVAHKDDFDALFGGLYIGKVLSQSSPAAKIREFFQVIEGQKILFLIDEYDHFANSILADDLKLFQKVMGKGGFVRSFYEVLKTATQRGTLDRLFVTGVTPLMLDSMTSGFNIGQNLSLHEDFNEAMSRETFSGEIFVIPNYAIREFYFHYFKVELERRNQFSVPNHDLRLAVEQLAVNADFQLLITQLERVMQVLSNRDALKMDEKHLKVILLTLLYQTQIYFIHSEREMGHKYPDILLLERNPLKVPFQHLVELKYCKKGDKPTGWEAKKQEGMTQVQGYLQLPEVNRLRDLPAWVLVTDGEVVEVVRVH